jgi:hypothetical protein
MDLSFESAEKYVWTWLDFFRLGPRRFGDSVVDNPDRYLTPMRFLFASIISAAGIVFIGVQTVVQSQTVALVPYRSSMGLDAKTFVVRHIFYSVLFLVFSTIVFRFALWWPLKSPASLKSVLTAKCYASAALVPFAAFDAVSLCIIVWLSPDVSADTLRWMVLGSFAIELLGLGPLLALYDTWSLCSFCQVRYRRLLQAQFVLTITGAVLGGCLGFAIGGMIGAIKGGLKGTPVHTVPHMIVFVFISILCTLFAWLVGGGLFFCYAHFLRKWLSSLQRKVQEEYAAYRVVRPY